MRSLILASLSQLLGNAENLIVTQILQEEAIEAAIRPASVEVLDGAYNSFQLSELVERTEIIMTAQRLLDLTYEHSAKTLPAIIDENLVQLPGGEDWKEGRR